MNDIQTKIADLFIVRHGQTDWNAQGRFQGAIERALDASGIQQAQDVAHKLTMPRVDAVYASHMLRARQTAEIIASPHQLPVLCYPELREGTYGSIDGLTYEEFRQRFADTLLHRESLSPWERFHDRLVAGAETSAEIVARALPCLHSLSQLHLGQRVVVVSHGWVMRSLYIYFSAFLDDKISVGNTGILHLQGNAETLAMVAYEGIVKT